MLCSSYRIFSAILCTVLASQVHATPLALEERSIWEAYQASSLNVRDVVAPPIIKPDATSVWPIGTVQEVTWDTSRLPPDNQITNPIGRVILGRDTGDSLNLDLKNPLAQGFHIRQGRVNITVPNVTPRPDYLIVLMGNSGNTSPSFAITRISGGDNDGPPSTTSSSLGPIIDPTPSLPGIVPTRSSRPATTFDSTPVVPPSSRTAITTSGSLTSVTLSSGVSDSITSLLPTTFSEAESTPTPSEGSQEDEESGISRSSANIALLMGTAIAGFLLAS